MSNNQIHPTAVIEGDVSLGAGNVVGPYSILIGPLEIGDNNIIGPHVCIGTPGQDTRNPRHDSSPRRIRIGSNNIIREFTAIQKPCYRDITQVGDDVFIMASVHVPHDAIIEDKAVITPMVVLAGITRIMEGANIGIGAAVHQFGIVGPYAIVGMGASVSKNVRPFALLIPGRPLKVNEYAVRKYGFIEHAEEIERYVTESVMPTAPRVLELVGRYQQLHLESGRPEYA